MGCRCGYTCGPDGETDLDDVHYPLPIRLGLPSITWYLRTAIGSCQEYTNTSSIIIPPPFVDESTPYPFVTTPRSAFCTHPSQRRWRDWLASVGSTLVILLFLTRLRFLQRKASVERDQLFRLALTSSWCKCGDDHAHGQADVRVDALLENSAALARAFA